VIVIPSYAFLGQSTTVYHETKEAAEALKLQAKEERKIKRAANALENKQLKEEKEAR
jgi:hypothetical protein